MSGIRRFFCLCLLVLTGSGIVRAQDKPNDIVVAAKRATGLVELPGDDGSGSAFCINPAGLFVTNYHVVQDMMPGTKVKLIVNSGETDQITLTGTVMRFNRADDLALIWAPAPYPLTALELDSSSPLTETQSILALGFPLGRELAEDGGYPNISVSAGQITSLRKAKGNLREIQINAAVNPGNSGGPLVSQSGKVIGVVHSIMEGANALSFAIPAVVVEQMLEKPVIVMNVPELDYAAAAKETTVSIRVLNYKPLPDKPEVIVNIVTPSLRRVREFPVTQTGEGSYESKVVFFPPEARASKLPMTFEVSVQLRHATISSALQLVFIRGLPPASPDDGPALTIPPFGGTPGAIPNPKPATPLKNEDWLGDPKAAGRKARFSVTKSNLSLKGPEHSFADSKFATIQLNAEQLTQELAWGADGQTLFLLGKQGLLHRIRTPEWTEDMTLDLGTDCQWMTLTSEGLAVGSTAVQRLFIIDPATFEVKREIPMTGMSRLAGTPALPVVFVVQNRGTQITIMNGKTGATEKTVTLEELRNTRDPLDQRASSRYFPYEIRLLTATPDGKYLFGECLGHLHRIRIEGTSLLYEETSEIRCENPRQISISADSQYVAMPGGGGNSDHPENQPYTTDIMRVTDLSKYVLAIASGPFPQDLAFDRAGGKVYAQNKSNQLLVYNRGGTEIAKYSFTLNFKGDVQRLSVSPKGNAVLILCRGLVLWAELAD